MTRIDELQKKYPSIPRQVIVKWDVMVRGVRDTADLDKVSTWGAFTATYQTYDHDVTLKDLAEKRPEVMKGGQVLRPMAFFLDKGLSVSIQRDTQSPYEIRDTGSGQFALFEGEERVDENIYFPPKPQPAEAAPLTTSKGTPIWSLVKSPQHYSEVCFFIMPVRHCEYFSLGEPCKFCNFNLSQEDARSIGMTVPATINLEETIEAYKIRSSVVRLVEGRFEMGGFMDSEREAGIFSDFIGQIARAAPYKPNFTIHTEAMSRKNMQRLKDQGLDCITIQMEVWDPELFAEICPGKAKHAPHQRWLEAFTDAVDVFGAGNVGGSIVAGLTLMPPKGHSTWPEALASHVEGIRYLVKNGVVPATSNLRLPAGSIYGENAANRKKLPPTDYYLEMAMAHHEAMMEHGLYSKMNKFMYCPLDGCGHTYQGELGWLALAGDAGKWLASAVPEKANWVARFISSVTSPTRS